VPGLITFAAMAVYTRLLSPDEFGRYALLIAGVGLINVVVFQWLRLVAVRFLPEQTVPEHFLGGILAQFCLLAAISSLVGLGLALFWPNPIWQRLLVLAVPLLVSQAAMELTLEIMRARLKPGRYGLLLGSKSAIALGVGAVLAWMGFGAAAPVWGLISGQTVGLLIFGVSVWMYIDIRWPSIDQWRQQLAYGLPLMATFALVWVISSSDRIMLAWFLDDDAAGVYSAGYDLAFQSLTLVATIINSAAYPLAVKALENGGERRAREQMTSNGELIIAAAMACATGLIALAPFLLNVFIGGAFRSAASSVFPVIVAAAALASIKSFHFDIAFHLGKKSSILFLISAVAALLNIVLNVLLIPRMGIVGSAWATLVAYGVALYLSIMQGRRVFSMPPLYPLFLKGSVVSIFAAAGLFFYFLSGRSGGSGVLISLISAACMVFFAIYLVDLAGVRKFILKKYS